MHPTLCPSRFFLCVLCGKNGENSHPVKLAKVTWVVKYAPNFVPSVSFSSFTLWLKPQLLKFLFQPLSQIEQQPLFILYIGLLSFEQLDKIFNSNFFVTVSVDEHNASGVWLLTFG